ncbi:nitroreductase [Parvularcula flava]|uniref:Nitroreductase n=1 Tax=Aquisalinus luteolus TaxID=1566827 RepID=A0ABX0HNB2_9PROT|nr:nitroreductase [Aquisalinus luteolus]
MSVSDAVMERRSIRAYTDQPVPRAVIEEILSLAARAPSGGNLQPWNVHVVTGEALDRLKAHMKEAIAASPTGEGTDFDIYPKNLPEPWRSRRHKVGEDLYALLGIERDNRLGRMLQFSRNYEFFGAPVGLFFSIDRQMGLPQWAHLGMFMQTIALLAVERGLSTCMQEAWAAFPKTVSAFLGLPDDRRLYCGMALGFADPDAPANSLRTERAALEDFAVFLDH